MHCNNPLFKYCPIEEVPVSCWSRSQYGLSLARSKDSRIASVTGHSDRNIKSRKSEHGNRFNPSFISDPTRCDPESGSKQITTLSVLAM
jgi:hypothetical protein